MKHDLFPRTSCSLKVARPVKFLERETNLDFVLSLCYTSIIYTLAKGSWMKLLLVLLSFLALSCASAKDGEEAVYITQLGTRVVVLATKCSHAVLAPAIDSAVSKEESFLFKDAVATRRDGVIIKGCALRIDKNTHFIIDENGEIGYLQNNTTEI